MKILFYYPSNKQSNPLETLIHELSLKSMEVFLLTTCEKGMLHNALEEKGIKTYASNISNRFSLLYYLRQIFFLIKFCKQQQIDFVFSHLQHVNIIAVFAQYFIRAKVIIFRHHFQYIKNSSYKFPRNKNEVIFDKIINRLAKTIVVPSTGVKNGMIKEERVNPKKIKIIPYLYDFDKYQKPNLIEVEKIRKQYPAKLRLIMVSRLIKLKQHHVVFPVIKELINEGLDINLLVLDEGPEEANLKRWITSNGMEDKIFMLGYRKDFVNYMFACDVLIQPSLTDASNSVVKEMGLLEKVVIVTEGVGDYSDYILHGKNGFLISKVNPEKEISRLIKEIYFDFNKFKILGKELKRDVIEKFSIKNSEYIINQCKLLLQN